MKKLKKEGELVEQDHWTQAAVVPRGGDRECTVAPLQIATWKKFLIFMKEVSLKKLEALIT